MTETEQATDTAEQVTEALKQLQRQLLHLARELANELQEGNLPEKHNQRVAAFRVLMALIETVLKLEKWMPRDEKEGSVIRIEYIDPDGSIHQTPPWAREDSEGEGEVQGGRVRTPVWEDRIGESTDS